MSLGYADRLSFREDLGGTLGAPELHDSDADVTRKVAILARYVRGLLLGYRRSSTRIAAVTPENALCAEADEASLCNGKGTRGGQYGGVHRRGHQHGVRHPRLSRPRWCLDMPASEEAAAASQHQLRGCEAQPHTPGVRSASATTSFDRDGKARRLLTHLAH